jgi:Type I phosphodiesterase / nucleotide pyrophosphatase
VRRGGALTPLGRAIAAVVVIALGVGAFFIFTGDDDPRSGSDPTSASSTDEPDTDPKDFKRNTYLDVACEMPSDWAKYIYRGWNPGKTRDYDIAIVPTPPNYMGTLINTSHSGPYDFLQEVPMILYGPGFVKPSGRVTLDREATVADIAATSAELMDYDFPPRKATPFTEVLEETSDKPKLILTMVIDGGGWNVLEEHPDTWPNMASLIDEGANIEDTVVGSSPSITPAVHTNIGTGSFPRQHGVTAIAVRNDEGNVIGSFTPVDSEEGVTISDPTLNLKQETLADMYDQDTGNEARVALVAPGNYQLGMIGFGLGIEGGDADIVTSYAKITDEWGSNSEFYYTPPYVNELEGPEDDLAAIDAADGEVDEQWRGHKFPPNIVATPALAPWQNRIIQALIENEGFGNDEVTDLLSINYKSPDSLGHIYNMISEEEGDTIESVDTAIGEMVEYLDTEIGEGEWVVMITADHGQTPLEAGGWPISRTEIKLDIDRAFDLGEDDLSLTEQTSATSFFMRKDEMKARDITPEQVSTFLTGYTIGDNIAQGNDVPEGYEDRLDEKIFDGVVPGRRIDELAECTGVTGE